MLLFVLVILVIASGAIVLEWTVLSIIAADNPWLKAAPSLVPFAALVATVFFSLSKDNWLTSLIRNVARRLEQRPWILYTTTFIVCAIAIMFGGYLWQVTTAKQGLFIVQVMRKHDVKEQRVRGVPVELEQKLRAESPSPRPTDDDGRAEFAINVDDLFVIRVRKSPDANAPVAILGNHKLEPGSKRGYLPVRLDDLDNSWIESASPRTAENLQVAKIPASFFRWKDDRVRALVIDFEADVPRLPFALPGSEMIIRRKAFTVGFSPLLRLPRWVAYRIVTGNSIPRRNNQFLADPAIPYASQAQSHDYAGNAYDRGHLVRRSDLFGLGEQEALKINLMSVVVPQLDVVNQKSWFSLEEHASRKAVDGANVYVIRGPIYDGPDERHPLDVTLMGPNAIAVPTHFFQIIFVADGASSLVEAHIVPNAYVKLDDKDITRFAATVAGIERLTGLSFDPNLSRQRID